MKYIVLLDCKGPIQPAIGFHTEDATHFATTITSCFRSTGRTELSEKQTNGNGGTMEDVSMLVCCFRISQMNFDDGICENGSLSNSIHVWYIYLHLP